MVQRRIALLIIGCAVTAGANAQESTVYTIDVRCEPDAGIFDVIGRTVGEDSDKESGVTRLPRPTKNLPRFSRISNRVNGQLRGSSLGGECNIGGRLIEVIALINPPQGNGECRGDWTASLSIREDGVAVADFPFFITDCKEWQAFHIRKETGKAWEACARRLDYSQGPAKWLRKCVRGDSIDEGAFYR